MQEKLAPDLSLWRFKGVSESPPSSPGAPIGKPVGRRGWLKQAGATVAGLTLGAGLQASAGSRVVKSARTTGRADRGAMRSPAPRRGIDCGFDEGPI